MTALNITPFTNTDTATADAFNERFAAVAAILNKGIDSDNIKDGGITAALLANDMLNKQYPVGSLYFNATVDTNPATLLGFGTWTSFGSGRTLVGFDGTQTEFNTVQKQGGHKELQAHSHTGSTSSVGNHSHSTSSVVDNLGPAVNFNNSLTNYPGSTLRIASPNTGGAGAHNHTFTTDSTGGGNAGNLQPYITVYIWVRVS